MAAQLILTRYLNARAYKKGGDEAGESPDSNSAEDPHKEESDDA